MLNGCCGCRSIKEGCRSITDVELEIAKVYVDIEGRLISTMIAEGIALSDIGLSIESSRLKVAVPEAVD